MKFSENHEKDVTSLALGKLRVNNSLESTKNGTRNESLIINTVKKNHE